MSDHPSTFHSEPANGRQIHWDDHASLHRKGDGEGLFAGFKLLRQGSLAELIAFVRHLPEADRSGYVILKSGDRRLEIAEIMSLANRSDFPG